MSVTPDSYLSADDSRARRAKARERRVLHRQLALVAVFLATWVGALALLGDPAYPAEGLQVDGPVSPVFSAPAYAEPKENSDPLTRARTEAQALRAQLAKERKANAESVRVLRSKLRKDTTISSAIRIAAITHGVSESKMRRVAYCESRHRARAKNPRSTASGLFQFLNTTWSAYPYGRAGLSVWDPYANAMQAAYVVKQDGSWRQWECG